MGIIKCGLGENGVIFIDSEKHAGWLAEEMLQGETIYLMPRTSIGVRVMKEGRLFVRIGNSWNPKYTLELIVIALKELLPGQVTDLFLNVS